MKRPNAHNPIFGRHPSFWRIRPWITLTSVSHRRCCSKNWCQHIDTLTITTFHSFFQIGDNMLPQWWHKASGNAGSTGHANRTYRCVQHSGFALHVALLFLLRRGQVVSHWVGGSGGSGGDVSRITLLFHILCWCFNGSFACSSTTRRRCPFHTPPTTATLGFRLIHMNSNLASSQLCDSRPGLL